LSHWVDAFICSIGTGGTLAGVGLALKRSRHRPRGGGIRLLVEKVLDAFELTLAVQ
jgi:threonine dehydratase